MAETKLVRIEDLTLDESVNIRVDLDEETVLRYMESFEKLPPVLVVELPDGSMLLCDGFHRTEAAARLGRKSLKAVVHKGDQLKAIELAATANVAHGLPLHADEQVEAVGRLLTKPPNGPGWQMQDVAEVLGVHRNSIRRMFRQYEQRQAGFDLTQDVADVIGRAPKELRPALAKAAEDGRWSAPDTLEVIRKIADNPKQVKSILKNAQPHLAAMKDRLSYVRMFDNALNTLRQLDSVGITPARLVGLVDDPAIAARWQELLPLASEYVGQVDGKFKRGGPKVLRVVTGGDR